MRTYLAQEIAQREQITQGLVCIFAVLEVCSSFAVIGNRKSHRLEVVRRNRKCLHLYWYLIDPEFGWMHVRVQTWAPYTIQIYINGREWMCRQLTRQGVDFTRSCYFPSKSQLVIPRLASAKLSRCPTQRYCMEQCPRMTI